MQTRKILLGLLALAIAFALSPMTSPQAASLLGPGSQPGTENMTYAVKAKAKAKTQAKAKAKKGKRVARKGPGHCGTGKYWDRKKRACAAK